MSVFRKLQQRVAEHAGKRFPDQLVPGKLYPVYKFQQRKSDYPKAKGSNEYPLTLVAYVEDGVSNYYLTMPSIYNDLSAEDVQEMNQEIASQKPPSICYYGKDGNRNDVLIHPFGEGKSTFLFIPMIEIKTSVQFLTNYIFNSYGPRSSVQF